MAKIVIVRDGITQWSAEKSSLIAALDAQGWEKTRVLGMAARLEPQSDEDDPSSAYAALCNAVAPIDTNVAEIPDDAAIFEFRPDANAWVWERS